MNSLNHFASFYDELTEDVPYLKFKDIIEHYQSDYQSHLEVGIGTGRISQLLNFKELYGIDIAQDMIDVVNFKYPHIHAIKEDVRTFHLNRPFDMITANLDVLCYMNNIDEFLLALKQCYNHLNHNGLMIFDVHSEHYVNSMFNNQTYSDDTEHITYIWNAIQEEINTVHHELTFFVKTSENLYQRLEETYFQRTYNFEQIKNVINKVGFKVEHTFCDYNIHLPVHEECDRIFFVIKKQ